jgi:hypothetical protein
MWGSGEGWNDFSLFGSDLGVGGLKGDRAPLVFWHISLPLLSVCVYKVFDAVFKFAVEHVTGSASS